MGSPDPRQIDGLGGATTVTSKVAMVSPSQRPDIDADYRFAQAWLDKAIVDTAPSCGNMLAGVGPCAIERGLVTADADETRVRILNITGPALNLRPRYNVALGPCPADGIVVQAVSTWVNKAANDDPRCIEALGAL